MASYLHGAYANYAESGLAVVATSDTLPVYFGAAAVHKYADGQKYVDKPIVLKNSKGCAEMGYSENWKLFSLCEAMYAHFMASDNVGPIVVINMLDPQKHRKASKTTVEVVFTGGTAKLSTTTAIINTMELESSEAFTAEYNSDGTVVTLKTTENEAYSGTEEVSFFEIDKSLITEAYVAEKIKETLPLVYETSGMVPTILAAPGWSTAKVVNDALKNAAQSINGHWNAFVFSDISASDAQEIEEAIMLAEDENRNSYLESPCWPMATDGEHLFHLSTLAVVKSQQVDTANGGVPYETTSNKAINIRGLALADGSAISFDKVAANELNENGIKTATYWGGSYRIWGPHTGAYDFNASVAPEYIFDCGVRMAQYLGNNFQLKYGDEVDKPMHRNRIDTILDAQQETLDNLINRGALLYGEIEFVPDDNPDSDIMSGQFTFSTKYTSTPAARAIINRYSYTAAGLEVLTSGGES